MGSSHRQVFRLLFFVASFLLATTGHGYLSLDERKRRHPEVFNFPYFGRGDPDHSFLHPYYPSPGGDPINAWFQLGTATVTRSQSGRDLVRLTSASQANQGILYNTFRTDSNNFNGYVDIQMDTSRESNEPADGMGLFFAKERPQLGSAMGIAHTYQGLGLVIDTFSNSRSRKTPYLYAYISDGTKEWNPNTDGSDTEIARGCQLEMNKKIRIYVQYVDEELHVGVAMNEQDPHRWHTCFKVPNVKLPFTGGGYLVFAAETGHFFAMHEVHDAAFVDESAPERHDYVPQDYGQHHDSQQYGEHQGQSRADSREASQADANVRRNKLHEERSDPASRVHQGGSATESLSGSMDLQVYDMFNEISAVLQDMHGKDVEETKLRLNGIRDVAGHLVKELEKQKADMSNVVETLQHLKATAGELAYSSDQFATQLRALHRSLRILKDKTEDTADTHDEIHAEVIDHQAALATQQNHGGKAIIFMFLLIQLLMVGVVMSVTKGMSSSKKLNRMV